MDGKRKKFTLKSEDEKKDKEVSRKARGDYLPSTSTSHTQFFRRRRHDDGHERITIEKYCGVSESISGSSDTFNCVHKPDGKKYTVKGLRKRNFLKELDPIPTDSKWTDNCPPGYGWDMAKKLTFLVKDPTIFNQIERFQMHLMDFAEISSGGYLVDILDHVCVLLDFLIEAVPKYPQLLEATTLHLQNLKQPILLRVNSDIVRYFDSIRNYIGFIGYTLMRLEDDRHFTLAAEALVWQLAEPDCCRPLGTPRLRTLRAAAAPVLIQAVTRMLAVATMTRFPTFITVALLLACDTVENCVELVKEKVIENVFYRFNPYFPEKKLPNYDINPDDPQDINVKLGASSVNLSETMSLLLVLLKSLKDYKHQNPSLDPMLIPCPDEYAQRCFLWAFRYECRARGRQHQRTTLAVIASLLLHCYGNRLGVFCVNFMPDVMTLAVLTELPRRDDWTAAVNINVSQQDVLFKKVLIQLSVQLLKVFDYNNCFVESRHWLLGLMYLIDPGLCHLRASWSLPLFAELRKTILQALVIALPFCSDDVVKEYGLVRRVMWYIEWYAESPYEVSTLYWCMRLLHVTTYSKTTARVNSCSIKDLYETHGLIILIHLCNTILQQKTPPVEKRQVVLSIALRLLSRAVDPGRGVVCSVYPQLSWPSAGCLLARRMLDTVLYSMEKHYIISDRWVISLLNFIWEGIIWKTEYRKQFVVNDGIYKLLDLITMSRSGVQCLALAIISDATRGGDAVGQLVSWRASLGASSAHPVLVKRGATIAALLAAIFRDDCTHNGVKLDQNGVILEMDSPIMCSSVRHAMADPDVMRPKSGRSPVCYAAGEIAGSRMSKAHAILHMLSEDLEHKVSIADAAYNVYKNIHLSCEDESILVLCSYYLTLKLNEVWKETQVECHGLLPRDQEIFEEFLEIGRGWSKEIKHLQQEIIERDRKKGINEERSLYAFLGRVRLNVALDALRLIRCTARSADRERVTQHEMLLDAVRAHHRLSQQAARLGAPILRTYLPKLDDQNMTGHNIKVCTTVPKDVLSPRDFSHT